MLYVLAIAVSYLGLAIFHWKNLFDISFSRVYAAMFASVRTVRNHMPKLVLSPYEQEILNLYVALVLLPYYIAYRIYVWFLVNMAHVTKQWWLLSLAPEWLLRFPKSLTSRHHYESERRFYREVDRLARYEYDLKRRHYYHYRYIARKYGWPYIKEAYDRDA